MKGVIRTYYKLCRLYYWPGLYAAVERYVLQCTDCSTGKGKPQFRGSSPGNITPTRPMQVVSMDAAGLIKEINIFYCFNVLLLVM
jgi:hypothetical protein